VESKPVSATSNSLSDFNKFLGRIFRRWHWFVISIGWAILIAFLVIRYQTPVYQVVASIITKKFEEGSKSMIPGIVNDDLFRNRTEVNQEIPLLKSYDKIKETIRRMDINVSYFIEGNIKTTEIYPDFIYMVKIDSNSTMIPYGIPVYIVELSGNKYKLEVPSGKLDGSVSGRIFTFDSTISFKGFSLVIGKANQVKPQPDYKYYFVVNNPEQLINEYRGKLNVAWQQQGSSILNVSILSPNPQKELEFIKKYFDVVINAGLEEKNAQASNILRFINQQMKIIGDSLFGSLVKIDNFKLENRELINGSDYVFGKLTDLDQQKAQLQLQNRYYDFLEKYVRLKRHDEVFAPSMIGITAPVLEKFVGDFIEMKMADKADMNPDNSLNPLVIRQDEKSVKLEKNIYENINNLREANKIAIHDIDEKIRFYFGSIRDLQTQTRELTSLQKLYDLNQNLYNLLLEKRTEASIAMASTTSDYQIVERPAIGSSPISPNKNQIYLVALALGIGLPLGLIYLIDLLNNKIISRDDLEKNTSIPVVGHIGHSILRTNLVVKENPKSLISEAFRTIRANLQYFIGLEDKQCNVIMVSSSISDEGKTFCSINLAYILALSGKKTLLLGADLRKPSLAGYFGFRNYPGVSNYLAGFNTLEDIVLKFEPENLKVILAGDIPPNPSELLASPKMSQFMENLKTQYDYIIIDTPPIGLVSDAFEILRYSDYNLLVVRQGRTIKTALAAVTELYQSGKIKHMGILFNDVDFSKLEYGYGYAYGYSYRYGYYNKYGYGYGYGYFDEEKEKKRGIFSRFRSSHMNGRS
jgi:capsular exopolysaccharide synthesis family protein